MKDEITNETENKIITEIKNKSHVDNRSFWESMVANSTDYLSDLDLDCIREMKERNPEEQIIIDLSDKRLMRWLQSAFRDFSSENLEFFLKYLDGFTQSYSIRKETLIRCMGEMLIRIMHEPGMAFCSRGPKTKTEDYFLEILKKKMILPEDANLCIRVFKDDVYEKNLYHLIPLVILMECGELPE